MTEPKRVDWTIEDAPSCADCVHCQPSSDWVKLGRMDRAIQHARCDLRSNSIYFCSTERMSHGKCKADAQFFERKPREHGNYDFENDPPIAMGWV